MNIPDSIGSLRGTFSGIINAQAAVMYSQFQ